MDASMTVLTIPRLGQARSDQQYRMRTLENSGAALAFGSDGPVFSGAPLAGLYGRVTTRMATCCTCITKKRATSGHWALWDQTTVMVTSMLPRVAFE